MKLNDRQKRIIDYAKNIQSFKHKDIIILLESKYSRITITRDLSLLVKKNILLKNGNGSQTLYSLSKNYKIFEEINIEEYFKQDFKNREVYESFNFDIFEVLANDIFTKEEKEKLEDLQSKFIKNISKYNSKTLINKEYERIMIEFSWKSSAIEGNTYSLLNTEALIKENFEDKTKTPEETQMILNHKDAFNESIQNRETFIELRKSSIEYIHSILIKNLDVTKNIRKYGVGITGTKYKPLNNEFQLKEVLDKTIQLINKKDFFLEKAFISLIMISYIQAFEDGNKRTARMFSNAILLANNSIPLSYRIVDIVEYKKASILFYELNNFSYFKEIFIEQFEDAVMNYFN